MNDEKIKEVVQKWVEAVHSGQVDVSVDYDELENLVIEENSWFDLYSTDWPCFGQVDEFPFSAPYLPGCIAHCQGEEEDDAIVASFRGYMEYPENTYFFLREAIGINNRKAWILVMCLPCGQAGVEQEIAGLFPTPLAAEKNLRAAGYIFTSDTPSGQVDSFTDDEIIEMVRSNQD